MKKLVKKDKKVFGVCGGLGDYFEIDPTIIRVLFVASVIFYGGGVLLYLILAIAMPDEPAGNQS